MEKCIACGLCAEKCPKKVVSEYGAGLAKRKAAYVQYAQAVPLKYALDPENCIYLQKGKCRACEKFCPADAIKFDDVQKDLTVQVGAIIFAGGCEVYDPKIHDVYGYGKSPNIVTSLEFERILSSSGPYGGHLVRPSDKKEPEKIAWLQCIGSRDTHIGSRNYCSSVCCTYAIKEAMLAKEHSKGSLDTAIFYMDIRTHGKDFERYYNRGRDEAGIRFVKSRITNIDRVPGREKLLIRYINEVGERVQEEFDMVVLSVGLGVKAETRELAAGLGIDLNQYDFASTNTFEPVETSVPGIMVCGAFEAPKDIPSSVMESSAAAGLAASKLYSARFTRTREKEVPQEVNVRGEPPRVGVFVCRCGTNIASVVDVPSVVEFARGLPGVVYTEENMFSCSQDTQEKMAQIIKEHRLNRIVVAACTPKTHEPLFQETVTNAGINKYLFEMANIRNQCSWVHSSDKDEATEKAKDLVRMAVAKVVLLEPLVEPSVEMNRSTLVVGGGISGMAAARLLSSQGYHVYLVEKEARLGGQALNLLETWRGEDIQEKLKGMIREVESDENIEIRLGASIKQVDGFVGNFKTTITRGGKGEEEVLEHGVAIIASGASELKPHELSYLYGKDPRVVTSLELDRRLIEDAGSVKGNQCVAFLQCVGSRIEERPYCSKVCCTHSVKSALKLKELNPDMDVFIIYRDMRTYGLREDLYREAREGGVVFLRYDFDRGLNVDQENGALRIRFTDTTIRREMEVKPDLFVLATAIVPPQENPLARMFKIPVNEDGFFMEAHVKLRPVDCATDGVFICGLAHAPKPIDEAIAQAQAAATRAVSVLAKERIQVSGNVA
ncbi:MAG: CoB--CoM heterodisulfide reductase iron-sulfur subunit A family protein, partial [Deltaproteobacteria bacterium]|nr:CoB--CoM heterodisulfide reductase iron-sulfur subunit A family protein [Deltaproteobacteria bacterium]